MRPFNLATFRASLVSSTSTTPARLIALTAACLRRRKAGRGLLKAKGTDQPLSKAKLTTIPRRNTLLDMVKLPNKRPPVVGILTDARTPTAGAFRKEPCYRPPQQQQPQGPALIAIGRAWAPGPLAMTNWAPFKPAAARASISCLLVVLPLAANSIPTASCFG